MDKKLIIGYKMNIKKADKTDYNEITAVWEDSVRATHDFLSETDINEIKADFKEKYLPMTDLYIYKSFFNEIVGFTGVSGDKVEMLFIASWARGGGIGKKLLNFAVSELGASKVDVNEQNISAAGFYRHAGFEITGRSPVDNEGRPFPLVHMELKK